MFIVFPKTDVQSALFDLKRMYLFEMVVVNLSTRDDSRVDSGRTGGPGIAEFKKQKSGCSSWETTLLT